MNLAPPSTSALRLSTGTLPASRRLATLRELFDRSIQMDIEAEPGHVVEMDVAAAPGLRRARMLSPFTARAARPAARLADGEDTVCLMLKTGGHLAVRQGRQEGVPELGDGVLMVYRQAARLQFAGATYLSVRVPFAALALLADVEAHAGRRIPRQTPALQLLARYVDSLPARFDDPQLARLAATHVHDLMALALGAHAEGRALAAQRGVRAARLAAIRADLAADPTLEVAQVAARQGVSTRYVQMLFEAEGSTFGQEALQHRLDLALALLTSPRYAAWSIAGIAMEAGFADLSHFNRRFKQRFQCTPREVRSRAAG